MKFKSTLKTVDALFSRLTRAVVFPGAAVRVYGCRQPWRCPSVAWGVSYAGSIHLGVGSSLILCLCAFLVLVPNAIADVRQCSASVGKSRFHLNRAACLGTMAARGSINGECRWEGLPSGCGRVGVGVRRLLR